MSAFMVSTKTIGRILAYIESDKGFSESWAERLLLEAGFPLHGSYQEQRECLRDLNRLGVVARYGPHDDLPGTTETGYFAPVLSTRHQYLKSLDCFIYQCSEGDVPQNPLYQAIDKLGDALAHAIATECEEYSTAEWDS